MENKIDEAKKALTNLEQVEYMLSTEGWRLLSELKQKDLEYALSQAARDPFYTEIMENPAKYARHVGNVEGLEYFDRKIAEFRRKAESARKFLEQHGH